MHINFQELLSLAKDATKFSHAPYSRFRVGASVLTENGVFIGANIENSSSNLGICAERVAIAHARMNGAYDIKAIAVYCIDAETDNNNNIIRASETMPCGACRQWLIELAPKAKLITNGIENPISISDLIPYPFIFLPKN